MSSNQQYMSIPELIRSIADKAQQIEKGNLSESEMERLIGEVRELNDRLVILQYKAYEKQVKNEESSDESPSANASGDTRKAAVDKKEPEPEVKNDDSATSGEGLFSEGFSLDFSSKEKNKIKKANKKKKKIKGKQESIPVPDQPLPFNNPNPPKSVEENEPEVEESASEDATADEEVIKDENQTNLIDAIGDDSAAYTINDKAGSSKQGETLASKLGKSPIKDLKSAIGINQKFLFMNDLFEGEHDAYHKALDKINDLDSKDEADKYIEKELVPKYNWDIETESVEHFLQLVERRFMA